MKTRPFRLCSPAECAAFEPHAAKALQAWARQWVGESAGLALACEVAQPLLPHELEGSDWLCAQGPLGSVWAEPACGNAVTQLLFDGAAAHSMASDVSRNALEALLRDLAGAVEPTAQACAAAPSHLAEHGRALLCLRIGRAQAAWRLLVELTARSDTPARKPTALAPVRLALGEQAVSVEVRLGEAEVALGLLRTLAVGDVLVLDRRLDQGVELHLPGQRLPCVGYLGTLDGRVAVEVARR